MGFLISVFVVVFMLFDVGVRGFWVVFFLLVSVLKNQGLCTRLFLNLCLFVIACAYAYVRVCVCVYIIFECDRLCVCARVFGDTSMKC